MNEALKKYLDNVGLGQVWSIIVQNFVKQEAGKGLSTNDLTDELLELLGTLESGAQVNVVETVKVNNVALEVKDKAVNILVPTGALASLNKVSESELDAALAALINGKADQATTYTKTETDSAIKSAVDTAVAGVYKVQGSITFENLPEITSESIKEGYVYNVSDAFTTTDDFLEGAGGKYPAGTNVVVVNVGEEGAASYKFDCMSGVYDFSEFLKKDDVAALTAEEIDAICKFPAE